MVASVMASAQSHASHSTHALSLAAEPKSPMWLPALGLALFALGGTTFALWPEDAPPPAAEASATASAEAPKPQAKVEAKPAAQPAAAFTAPVVPSIKLPAAALSAIRKQAAPKK
jgi:hypothetical protein